MSLETLLLITKPHLDGSTWSPVPINTDFCSMLLAQLTHHLKSKQIDKGLDCSRSRVSGCWRLGRRCSLSLPFFFFFALEAVFLIEGRSLEGRPFFPGLKNRHFAYGTHPVGRKPSETSDGFGVCQDLHPEGQ